MTIGNTTLVARISVTVTAPTSNTPTLAFTPPTQSVSIVAGQSVFVDNTLKGSNNTAGNAGLSLWCMQSACPAGFSYNFPTASALSANGSASARVTFFTTPTTIPGTYNYEYRAALGSLNAVAKFAVTVTAPISTADFTAVAVSSNISTVQGSNNSLQATITPSGGLTGPVSMTVAGAPAGVTIASASGNITTGAITLTSMVSVLSTAVAGSYSLTASVTGGGKTKTVSFTLVVSKPAVTTGTVAFTTTSNIGVNCTLNGVYVSAPTTLANQPAGSKSLSCTAPAGYTIGSISPSSTQNLTGGGTVNFVVTLVLIPLPPFSCSCSFARNPATVGQLDPVSMSQSGGVAPVTFIANGLNLGTGTTLNITPVAAGSATVQFTATDAKGRQASNSCSVSVVAPQPVLNSLTVNTSPKVNTAINVSLFGSGFVSSSQGYVCGSTAASSCSAFPTVFINSGQLSLQSVRWSAPATIYLKVMNGSLSSGFVTMVVIK